jgi:basic amino acid/polyamine antiporter, APA family
VRLLVGLGRVLDGVFGPGAFRTKKLDDILAAAEKPQYALRRSLGAFNVTLLGIGAIVGAGIFATIGTGAAGDAARPGAGPSLVLSFTITACVCAFTALCYAEFASLVPISGSAYTYSYATLGELVAWIIGWDLIIEYAIGNVAVAISWSNYFRSLLESVGVGFPAWLATDYRTAAKIPGLFESAPHIFGIPIVFNLLAFGIVALITMVLVWGIRESARFNAIMVGIKILVLLFFVVVALRFVSPAQMEENWHPFQPNGWSGTLAGAAVIFFAYIGFDAVSTVAEETRNPSRDLPIGILMSLIVCTVLYIVVAAVFTGMLPYDELRTRLATEQAEPLTMALQHVAPDARWARGIVAFGSVVAHTAVLLVFQLGQPRIFFSMARDGLLPKTFAKVHPKFRTPYVTTILTGIVVGGLASVASIDEMVDLTNIGTLFAFILVCIGVPVMRYLEPNRARPFRVPLGNWLLPLLGAAACIFLMVYLPPASWWRFFGWLMLGLAVYTAYGHTHSVLARRDGAGAAPATPIEGGPQVVRTPGVLRIASAGFLVGALGLFVMPHGVPVHKVFMALSDTSSADHGRAWVGFVLALVGLLVGFLGMRRGVRLTARDRKAR